jgi:hypothetical protein
MVLLPYTDGRAPYECGQDAHRGKLPVTRLMNGFSKKLENYGATVALYFMYYNFAAFTRGKP